MNYFLDTEFIEDGKTIDLISLGIAAEDGRTLYLQNVECVFTRASEWVWRNVYPHLLHFHLAGRRSCSPQEKVTDSGLQRTTITRCFTHSIPDAIRAPEDYCPWATRREIRDAVLAFCDQDKHSKPEFWGYYADYDWVVFCQLFGTMMELPKGWPMYCRDLKQLLDDKGNPRHQKDSIHHALSDAEWIKETYEALLKDNPSPVRPEGAGRSG